MFRSAASQCMGAEGCKKLFVAKGCTQIVGRCVTILTSLLVTKSILRL